MKVSCLAFGRRSRPTAGEDGRRSRHPGQLDNQHQKSMLLSSISLIKFFLP